MGSPKQRPTADELRKLYETMTSQQIANTVGVHKTTVCKWLRDASIKARKFSPMTAKRVDCPYTPERLREMYWRDGMSISEIGAHAAKLLGREAALFQKTVQRWMSEAGINWRTAAEAQQVEARRFPEKAMAEARNMRGKAGRSPGSLTPGLMRSIDRKRQRAGTAKAATIKKAEAAKHNGGYTRPCCWPGCNQTTTRRPSEFHSPVWFCGRRHANFYQHASPKTREECLENAQRHIEGY